MQTWQLQEAKAHLSEVIRLSVQQGPQVLTVRGKEEADFQVPGLEVMNPFE